jgi:hypothetical protein
MPQNQIILDAFYSQLAMQDPVTVQRGNEFPHAATITELTRQNVPVGAPAGAPTFPASLITIDLALPTGWSANPERLIIHFRMVDSGKLTRVAKTQLSAADFTPPGVPTEGLVEPIPESVAKPSELLLLDAMDNGVLAGGAVNINASGEGKVQLAPDTPPFAPALRTPVTIFGNLVRATAEKVWSTRSWAAATPRRDSRRSPSAINRLHTSMIPLHPTAGVARWRCGSMGSSGRRCRASLG